MKKLSILISALALVFGVASCSDAYLEDMNTDKSKATSMDPNALLTNALLQPYGDFGLMDTYRSYITGFTQHMAGGWNVTNYAGCVHADNSQMSRLWDQFYLVGIKNLVDGIANSAGQPNLNAILRIHFVYMMSILTDTYGDVPCFDAGKGYVAGKYTPAYDSQKDIYDFFFDELTACVGQLGTGTDVVTGDVTAYDGAVAQWKKYANSLRMRFAMRISSVEPERAKSEFEAALAAPGGYIASAADDAYVRYIDGPFTLYKGSEDLDFRVNAFGEILYGQDPTSPTFICATLFNQLRNTNDPRLYRICRHYINTKRSDLTPDAGNVDLTDEVLAWQANMSLAPVPNNPGAAWYNDWPASVPSKDDIPTLAAMCAQDPAAGYDQNNFPVRMIRPALSIEFERPDRPGILFTSAETEFLLAEAYLKNWDVQGTAEDHYKAGIAASMALLNKHYLPENQQITPAEISTFIGSLAGQTIDVEAINTQAWILHLVNPSEAWANLRRSDYPVLMDRTKLDTYPTQFTYDDDNLNTPTRLKYPNNESVMNTVNYQAAVKKLSDSGKDDWHVRVWWDTDDIHVQ